MSRADRSFQVSKRCTHRGCPRRWRSCWSPADTAAARSSLQCSMSLGCKRGTLLHSARAAFCLLGTRCTRLALLLAHSCLGDTWPEAGHRPRRSGQEGSRSTLARHPLLPAQRKDTQVRYGTLAGLHRSHARTCEVGVSPRLTRRCQSEACALRAKVAGITELARCSVQLILIRARWAECALRRRPTRSIGTRVAGEWRSHARATRATRQTWRALVAAAQIDGA